MSAERPHVPVLLEEVIEFLKLSPGANVIDCTVGAGGHAAAILDATSPDGRLLGLDLDEAALGAARENLRRFGSRAMLVRGNYRDVAGVLPGFSTAPVQAALLDLGYSSIEIDDPRRGFSFRFDGPLDMRFDERQETTAAEVLNSWSEEELSRMLWEYGEERLARKIAKAVVIGRREKPIVGTLQLVDLIAHAVPAWYRRGRIHFATRTFQALRIAVNDELGNVRAALPELLDALAPGGRMAVISFHSLEDRIVKEQFRDWEKEGRAAVITKKPVTASTGEVAKNPRSRSAKMRIAEKR
jgi:16S rRNA (cytosine1402-N4)-methyltransferase